MSLIEHELVCPRCRGPVVLDGPLRCVGHLYADGDLGCGWSSMSAGDAARSGRTRPNQETPFR
jgi:hypothetical protein